MDKHSVIIIVVCLAVITATLFYAKSVDEVDLTPVVEEETPKVTIHEQIPSPEQQTTVFTPEGLEVAKKVLFTPDLYGVEFETPEAWGDIYDQPNLDQDFIMTRIVDGQNRLFMAFVRQEPDARGGYWGDIAYDLTTDNAETFCDVEPKMEWVRSWVSDCSYFTNEAGIQVTHFHGNYEGFRDEPVEANVYVIPYPGDEFIAVVVSDERLVDYADELGGDVQTLARELVNGFSFATKEPVVE